MNFLESVTEEFNKNNWRITLGVRNIAEILDTADSLYSVQTIKKILKKQKKELDIATIYRILEKFLTVDLVHEFDGKWKKCADPTNEDEHHFLVCERCGSAKEIFLDYKHSISGQLAKEKNFLLREVHLAFLGVCENCHSKK